MAQGHREGPHMGETASIAFGRTERPGLSTKGTLCQSRRINAPNMYTYMYTPPPRSDKGVRLTT